MFARMSSQPINLKPLLLGMLAALLGACAATSVDQPAVSAAQIASSTPAGRGDPDKLIVVDCLLPGQVRKLGSKVTYLTARRPIKTTAGDCEIRGGEYVAYDRANYKEALRFWLPPAQEGDPEAQTYVGEIYERGLGVPPNYELAAQWYRKAAEQGYSRAQTNLGFLYEKGLGVPRDSTRALNLYRQASGLTSDQLAFTSSVRELESQVQQLQAKRRSSSREAEQQRGQAEQLQRELRRTQQELEAQRKALRSSQEELERTRRELQRRLETPTTQSGDSASVRELEQRLAQQQARLAEQSQKIGFLQQEAENKQTKLSTESQQSQSLQEQMRALQQQLEASRQQLASSEQVMEAQRRELQEAKSKLEQQEAPAAQPPAVSEAEFQSLQNELAQRNQDLAETRNNITALEAQLQQRQTDLQAEASGDTQETKSLEQQVSTLQQELEEAKQQLSAREQAWLAQQEEIQKLDQTVAKQQHSTQERSAAALEEILRLEEELAERNTELARTKGKISAMEEELQQRQQEMETVQVAQADSAQFRSGTTESAEPGGLPSAPKWEFGRYYALIIGNNQYANFPNLQTAVNDARALARVLESRYGFNTKVLMNADRYAILSALNEFREKLTSNDNFLVYYAGHGELDRANARGYWLPVDAEPNSTANWISNVQVTDTLNAMNAKHVMVIADSCYSGALTRAVTTSLEGGRTPEQKADWLKLMIKTRSRTVLSSGGVKPVLDSGGGDHSVFAQRLLAVLQSNDGILEGPMLYQRVAGPVKKAAATLNVDQDPEYAPIKFAGDLGAPFFFVPSDRVASAEAIGRHIAESAAAAYQLIRI